MFLYDRLEFTLKSRFDVADCLLVISIFLLLVFFVQYICSSAECSGIVARSVGAAWTFWYQCPITECSATCSEQILRQINWCAQRTNQIHARPFPWNAMLSHSLPFVSFGSYKKIYNKWSTGEPESWRGELSRTYTSTPSILLRSP